ncbi:hypothetical protein Droror1_Dr00006253 [Drosera rotundifolia]
MIEEGSSLSAFDGFPRKERELILVPGLQRLKGRCSISGRIWLFSTSLVEAGSELGEAGEDQLLVLVLVREQLKLLKVFKAILLKVRKVLKLQLQTSQRLDSWNSGGSDDISRWRFILVFSDVWMWIPAVSVSVKL